MFDPSSYGTKHGLNLFSQYQGTNNVLAKNCARLEINGFYHKFRIYRLIKTHRIAKLRLIEISLAWLDARAALTTTAGSWRSRLE